MAKKEKQEVLVSYKFLPIFETLIKKGKAQAAAELTVAILRYDMDGTEPQFTDDSVLLVWETVIRPRLDENKEAYNETIRKRKAAGKQGGDAKAENSKSKQNVANLPNGSDANQELPNLPDNDNDNDYDVDVDSDSKILNNPNGLLVGTDTDEAQEQESRFGKFQDIADAWNSLPLANIMSIKGTRLKLLNARVKEYGVDDVIHAITMIKNSKFLLGQNSKGWQITFDWFIKPNNFGKVLEGNYDDKHGVNTGPKGRNDVEYGFGEAMSILGLGEDDG